MKRNLARLAILSLVIFSLIPLLKLGWISLELAQTTQQTLSAATDYGQNIFTDSPQEQLLKATQLKADLNKLHQTLEILTDESQQSWGMKKIMQKKSTQLGLVQDLSTIAQKLLTDQQTYILLFQNSEELRATGGFLGSYAKVELDNGVLKTFEIQDIYVPDGQFQGFVQAPAGAKEYLSGGEGLRLRDANWNPDFPASALQVLNYFAWGKEVELDGVVALNLPLVEKILTLSGPIYLSDYAQTITANNFSDLARANRGQFFPGSQQKQHFLSTFFNQLIIKLQSLKAAEVKDLAKIVLKSAQEKDLQFFSHDAQLQLIFEKLQINGELSSPQNTATMMLVESNVGINKANQHVERAVTLKLDPNNTQVRVDFTNHNYPPDDLGNNQAEAPHLTYVNYQRLITPPNFEVQKIIFNAEEISTWDEELMTNSKNQTFKQIGFLVTIPEQTSRKLEIDFSHPQLSKPNEMWLQKQAGLPPILYHLTYLDQTQSLELEKNTLVQFLPQN